MKNLSTVSGQVKKQAALLQIPSFAFVFFFTEPVGHVPPEIGELCNV